MNNKTYAALRPVLQQNADEAYRAFHARLVPGIHDFLGVRMPVLRSIARDVRKTLKTHSDWTAFFAETPALYEEIMLRGILIGLMPVRLLAEALPLPTEFYHNLILSQVALIDNWALCDCFCSGLKQKSYLNDTFLSFLRRELLLSPHADCWRIRVGLVLLLAHFTDENHITQVLELCRLTAHRLPEFPYDETFYIRMGLAWLLAEAYIKCRAETEVFLFGPRGFENLPDRWTFNKTIQKIIESDRIEPDEKKLLKTRKR